MTKSTSIHEIFLSYSHEDTHIMSDIRTALLEATFTVWTDEGITVGTPSWRDAVQTAIENAGCVVVIFSPSAKNSFWVKEELSYASSQDKIIIPLLIEGDEKTSLPFGYSARQYVDLRLGIQEIKERLIPTLNELFEKKSIVDPRQIYLISSWSKEMEPIIEAVKQATQKIGFKTITGLDLSANGPIEASVLETIRSSNIVIVDLSFDRLPVYYEYGYARGLGKSIILIASENTRINFDVLAYRTIIYSDLVSLKTQLRNHLVHGRF